MATTYGLLENDFLPEVLENWGDDKAATAKHFFESLTGDVAEASATSGSAGASRGRREEDTAMDAAPDA